MALLILVSLCGVLALVPVAVLREDHLNLSVFLTFAAILTVGKFGGLLFAGPAALWLLLYFLWVWFVGHARTGAKRGLFVTTLILAALYFSFQMAHLPIRLFLNQNWLMIEANIAGILISLVMLSAPVELSCVLLKQRAAEQAKEAACKESEWVVEDSDVFVKPPSEESSPS